MKFILSLDCEGKWGMADCLTSAHRETLSEKRLRQAYGDILRVLDEYQISATFAFTGLWSLSRPDLDRALAGYVELAPWYLAAAGQEIDAGRYDGWVGDWALADVASAKVKHEIALHGVAHIPWTNLVSRSNAVAELEMFHNSAAPIKSLARTYVYPRNVVAYPELLPEFGIIGYRGAIGERSRLRSLLSEFNLLTTPDAEALRDTPLRIPPGVYLNWRSGLRKLVPAAVTIERARLLLERASVKGGVVHYWTHPENIASGPQTLDLLRRVVALVARLRDEGRIRVMTQFEYCAERVQC